MVACIALTAVPTAYGHRAAEHVDGNSKSHKTTYRQLVARVAKKSELSKEVVRGVLTALREVTSEMLANEDWVLWDGVGTFEGCAGELTRTVCFRSERETVRYMRWAMDGAFRDMATDLDQFDFTPIPQKFEAEFSAFDERVAAQLVSHVPDFVGYMWFALADSGAPGAPEKLPPVAPMTTSGKKSEMINSVHARSADQGIELTKKATGELLDMIFDVISGSINHEQRFSYPGFGTFTVKHRKAREGRNPRTGKPIKIPKSYTVSFKPRSTLKDLIN
ncbi:MAG: hypothetical protein BMS9Abin37_3200 [Acidobacteriota bacterium]|nr:MAG: hypothetical protein BMS9Abin37_3200 [Acidobacteriota bacterium]